MTDILEQNQVAFCEIPIYDVVGTRMENMEYFDQMNGMLFVSASGVRAFAAQTEKEKLIRLKEWVKKGEVQIAALGKVTREALEKAGLDVEHIQKNYLWSEDLMWRSSQSKMMWRAWCRSLSAFMKIETIQ